MKFEFVGAHDGKRRDTARIDRKPLRNDRSQIGLAANRKVKPDGVHIGLYEPIGHASLQSRFDELTIAECVTHFEQPRPL